jgi:hypothetical protein
VGQAKIAANKDLKFEIPAVDTDTDRQETSLSNVSHYSSELMQQEMLKLA